MVKRTRMSLAERAEEVLESAKTSDTLMRASEWTEEFVRLNVSEEAADAIRVMQPRATSGQKRRVEHAGVSRQS